LTSSLFDVTINIPLQSFYTFRCQVPTKLINILLPIRTLFFVDVVVIIIIAAAAAVIMIAVGFSVSVIIIIIVIIISIIIIRGGAIFRIVWWWSAIISISISISIRSSTVVGGRCSFAARTPTIITTTTTTISVPVPVIGSTIVVMIHGVVHGLLEEVTNALTDKGLFWFGW